ncbi:hypothetical protein [Burkholderia plantarii]|uniref:hypothetical protein n=1 Tax=Burkholderia plantarii TaxID=41899 RepID=UPI000870B5C4|nr:hypothetical protein [Burkholderia plantarii]WLE62128.1 hypothetical protein GIY62_32550 [Burkholderia plantarii]
MSISTDILTSLSQQLGESYGKFKARMETEANYLEGQSMMIAKGRAAGQIPDDQFDWLVKNLQTDAENFCRILCMQTLLTIEAAWNAVVRIVWSAINSVLGASGLGALAIPMAPAA